MDMQTGGGFVPPAKTDSQELTFHWLYQRVQGLVEHSIYPKRAGWRRGRFASAWVRRSSAFSWVSFRIDGCLLA